MFKTFGLSGYKGAVLNYLRRSSFLAIEVHESDVWWFGLVYDAVIAFADAPENTISRIGGGRIHVADDLANQLFEYLKLILAKYPEAADCGIVQVAQDIVSILTRKGRLGTEFEEEFWTNRGFLRHPDWDIIREKAREFLLR